MHVCASNTYGAHYLHYSTTEDTVMLIRACKRTRQQPAQVAVPSGE